ncbi:hypothetical protein [Methylocaldum szegediense]|jgi:hypothetical protein|uniref:Uncharacterized protein n=1 Tax=Methylocaldum szegediense TaxID=73780 RepID=A0ABM9I0K1_9GAMM|nr:hypothetical protein [Methylocaldum szegediense]CAI8808968.1 exported protein of unknown function [Methylocaldum szegediense]
MKSLFAGVVLSTLAFSAGAEAFATLNGIPADAMSAAEMQLVEGKGLIGGLLLPAVLGLDNTVAATLEAKNLNVLGLITLGELGRVFKEPGKIEFPNIKF